MSIQRSFPWPYLSFGNVVTNFSVSSKQQRFEASWNLSRIPITLAALSARHRGLFRFISQVLYFVCRWHFSIIPIYYQLWRVLGFGLDLTIIYLVTNFLALLLQASTGVYSYFTLGVPFFSLPMFSLLKKNYNGYDSFYHNYLIKKLWEALTKFLPIKLIDNI